MNRRIVQFLCCVTLASASLASAQQNQRQLPRDPERPRGVINDVTEAKIAMHPVTPFVEESTIALIKIDLSKLNLEANLQLAESISETDPTALNVVRGGVESLRRAGVKVIYTLAGTRSVSDGGPLVVIPCDDTTAVRNLAEMVISQLPNREALQSHAGNEVVLVGPRATIDRVLKTDSVTRPRLILPLTELSDYHHMVTIALKQEYREELAALWPDQMPSSFPFELSPKKLAKDVRAVYVAWKMPPTPDVQVKFVCDSQPAAERLRKQIEQVLAAVPPVANAVDVAATPDAVIVNARADILNSLVDTVIRPARKRAEVLRVSNSMKQLGLAFHNYSSAYKRVVPLYLTDPEGTPLYSWRVELLPFMEQQALFEQFKRDQAWNSPANQEVAGTRIPTLTDDASLKNKTTFRAPVYPGSLWYGDGPPRQFKDVTDGLSNTIIFIDAPREAAVEWAKPEPWKLSDDLMKDIFGDRDRVHVGLMDGAVIVLEKSEMTNEKLKALLTIAGGETVDWLW